MMSLAFLTFTLAVSTVAAQTVEIELSGSGERTPVVFVLSGVRNRFCTGRAIVAKGRHFDPADRRCVAELHGSELVRTRKRQQRYLR